MGFFFCCLQIWWIKANFAPVLSQNLPKIVLFFIKDKITGSRDGAVISLAIFENLCLIEDEQICESNLILCVDTDFFPLNSGKMQIFSLKA